MLAGHWWGLVFLIKNMSANGTCTYLRFVYTDTLMNHYKLTVSFQCKLLKSVTFELVLNYTKFPNDCVDKYDLCGWTGIDGLSMKHHLILPSPGMNQMSIKPLGIHFILTTIYHKLQADYIESYNSNKY